MFWAEELSETCRVLFQKKFEKTVHLVDFIIRNVSKLNTRTPPSNWNGDRGKVLGLALSPARNYIHHKLCCVFVCVCVCVCETEGERERGERE